MVSKTRSWAFAGVLRAVMAYHDLDRRGVIVDGMKTTSLRGSLGLEIQKLG